jgi:hypothetical protein
MHQTKLDTWLSTEIWGAEDQIHIFKCVATAEGKAENRETWVVVSGVMGTKRANRHGCKEFGDCVV